MHIYPEIKDQWLNFFLKIANGEIKKKLTCQLSKSYKSRKINGKRCHTRVPYLTWLWTQLSAEIELTVQLCCWRNISLWVFYVLRWCVCFSAGPQIPNAQRNRCQMSKCAVFQGKRTAMIWSRLLWSLPVPWLPVGCARVVTSQSIEDNHGQWLLPRHTIPLGGGICVSDTFPSGDYKNTNTASAMILYAGLYSRREQDSF